MTKIKVALRVRPFSVRELEEGYKVVVGVEENSAFITDIKVPERPSADSRQRYRRYDFDHAFWLTEEGDDGSSQEEIYQEMGPSLQESILEGYNACLLAYGQSGTGKTHTMLGSKDDPGLIPRLCQGLWEKFKRRCLLTVKTEKSFKMEVSFMEIYREKVRDLLTPSEKPLKLREHPQLGPHVQGLKRIEISEGGLSILDLLWEGERRRASGATGSNRRSSRSHAIWTLYLTSTRRGRDGTDLITRNQVHLVDLAGSEKADLITTKHLLAEGKDINRSLVSLGNVISSLAEKASYIPYRDSTLTWLLKDSLGGNAATAIIITASPASWCHAQTLNSFRFAQRARLVENQPKINVTKSEGKSNSTNRRNSSIFSGMSHFDLKKDIARLATLIRSAQANGGILRSLAPANGWNRLIAAIENWNHFEGEGDSKIMDKDIGRRMRKVSSNDTLSTMVADGEVQVNMKSTVSSVPSSPSKTSTGTEVFIPISKSYKCLTWRQEEVKQIPKEPEEEEDEVFLSPPQSPKIQHMKYIFPVHYPTTRNLETGSRMLESVTGKVDLLNSKPVQISPIEIKDNLQTPLVCEKLPTLVNPQEIDSPLHESVDEYLDENLNCIKSNVQCKGQDRCFHIPNVSEFSNKITIPVFPFQSGDHQFEKSEMKEIIEVPRLLKLQKGSKNNSEEDTGFVDHVDSDLISSSSYESLQVPSHNHRVKIVENSDFNFSDIEDRCEPFTTAIPCFHLPPRMTSVTEHQRRISSAPVKPSRFRKFFQKEFEGLEEIGKQIKNLKTKAERCSKVLPYLNKVVALGFEDHTKPNVELDAEIEQCSGWNVQIELEKVMHECNLINKILTRGSGAVEASASESSISNTESTSSSGSISFKSHRNSNPDSLFGSFQLSSAQPLSTSTPKKPPPLPNTQKSSAFCSEFYKKNQGPSGDYSPEHKEPDIEPYRKYHGGKTKWKPFLPKTHSYLCHQRTQQGNSFYCPPACPPPQQRRNSSLVYESMSYPQFYSQPPPPQQQRHPNMNYLYRHPHPQMQRSLSSDGSSYYDGSLSDHYQSYGNEYCSCHPPASFETNQTPMSYWDSSQQPEFPNRNYHYHESYSNGYSHDVNQPSQSSINNYYPTHLVTRGSKNYGKYKNEF